MSLFKYRDLDIRIRSWILNIPDEYSDSEPEAQNDEGDEWEGSEISDFYLSDDDGASEGRPPVEVSQAEEQKKLKTYEVGVNNGKACQDAQVEQDNKKPWESELKLELERLDAETVGNRILNPSEKSRKRVFQLDSSCPDDFSGDESRPRDPPFRTRIFRLKNYCRKCDEVIGATKEEFSNHLITHKKPFRCGLSDCKRAFRSYDKQKRHMARHVKRYEHVCPCCSLRFRYAGSLKFHSKSKHSGQIRYECPDPDCDSGFYYESELRKHSLKHQGDITLQCIKCSATFKSSFALKYHLRKHQEDRFFKCPQCPEAFLTRAKLQAHILSKHERNKRFKCKKCGKRLSTLVNYKAHIVRNSCVDEEEKPFKCQYENCGYSYSVKASLYSHNRYEHGYVPKRRHFKNKNRRGACETITIGDKAETQSAISSAKAQAKKKF